MMSLQATLSNSNSIPDSSNASRAFATSFSGQSASTPVFHHSGTMQGLQNFHGSFNTANIPGSLASRSSALSGVPSTGVQQPSGGLPTGRFTSNNLPVALSQLPHGGLHGPSGVSNRGSMSVTGSPAFSSSTNGVGPSGPGIPPTSVSIGNRNAVPGLGVLGNNAPRLANSISSMVGTGSVGRNMNFGGGLGMPTMASRMNLTGNSGAGNLNVPQNRLMSGVLPQGPQMMSMLGNSYSSFGGPLGQNQIHTGNNALNSISMSNDMNSNEGAPFDINDFPQLTGRPSSAGGPQGQLGSLRKQGVGVSSIVQPSQEFSIQNEDFPALPGFKGGNTEFPMDLHQKEVHHENAFSMMQSQHFPVARSSGFGLTGSYTSQRQQQQQQQHLPSVSSSGVSYAAAGSPDLLHMHGSDLFSSSHGMSGSYHSQVQNVGAPNLGVRSMNASNAAGMGSYDPFIKQYQQHHQIQPQFRLQQALPVTQSYRDQNMKLLSGMQAPPDPFGLLGLLSVIRMNDPDLTSLALGIDLTTLGLNLNSRESLYKTFGSPWSDAPTKGEPEYNLPQCYIQAAPWLQPGHFSRFRTETLFYIFYSMPNDEAQLFAANELHNQGWFFHRELRQWILKASNSEALSKTHSLERGTYLVFDPNNWETVRKDNFIVAHEQLEKRPVVPQH